MKTAASIVLLLFFICTVIVHDSDAGLIPDRYYELKNCTPEKCKLKCTVTDTSDKPKTTPQCIENNTHCACRYPK